MMIGCEKNHTKSHSFLDLDTKSIEMQESFDWRSYLVLDYFGRYITKGTKGIVYCGPAQVFTSLLLPTLDNLLTLNWRPDNASSNSESSGCDVSAVKYLAVLYTTLSNIL